MLRIGLTGGIASGKSTVSKMFKEAGYTLIDADLVAREVLNIYTNILDEVKKEFGEGFFDESGNLKRKDFGNYIFKYPRERIKYEGIIIPFIKKRIFELFDEYEAKGESIVILDAPTLIENKLHEVMDYNILVWANKDVQISRLIKRDGFTEEEALNRVNAQMPMEERKEFVNFIVDNSNSLEDTEKQVLELINIFNMYKK